MLQRAASRHQPHDDPGFGGLAVETGSCGRLKKPHNAALLLLMELWTGRPGA